MHTAWNPVRWIEDICNGHRTMWKKDLGHPRRHIPIRKRFNQVEKRNGMAQTKVRIRNWEYCELIINNVNNCRIYFACIPATSIHTSYSTHTTISKRSTQRSPAPPLHFNSTQTHTKRLVSLSLCACRTIACRCLIALHSAMIKVWASGFLCSPHAMHAVHACARKLVSFPLKNDAGKHTMAIVRSPSEGHAIIVNIHQIFVTQTYHKLR